MSTNYGRKMAEQLHKLIVSQSQVRLSKSMLPSKTNLAIADHLVRRNSLEKNDEQTP